MIIKCKWVYYFTHRCYVNYLLMIRLDTPNQEMYKIINLIVMLSQNYISCLLNTFAIKISLIISKQHI